MFRSWEEYFEFEKVWQDLIDKVEISGALPVRFQLRPPRDLFGDLLLDVYMGVECVHTGGQTEIRKGTYIPHNTRLFQTEHDRLTWLRREVQSLYLHELDEQFKFDGAVVFDPHKVNTNRTGDHP
jgi:hypothetical protein